MQLASFKHVIWDWNGTLLNDTTLCVEIINEMLASESLPGIDVDTYRRTFTFPVKTYYERIGLDLGPKSFEELSARYIAEYTRRWNQCALHSGARECLENLATQGISQSILSASEEQSLHEAVEFHGLRDLFLRAIGQGDIYARGKLNRGREWVEQLDWNPEEILLIGDTLHDFEVARTIGLQCLLVSHGHQCQTVLQGAGLPLCRNFHELADILQRGEKRNLSV